MAERTPSSLLHFQLRIEVAGCDVLSKPAHLPSRVQVVPYQQRNKQRKDGQDNLLGDGGENHSDYEKKQDCAESSPAPACVP
jgi:hypothetical protein